MRQLFLDRGSVTVRQVFEPLLEEHSVLVSVHYSFISSGTESSTIAQSQESLLFSNVTQKIKKVLETIATNGIEATKALIKGKLKGSAQSLGYSCSGEVIAVGSKVTSIKVGDLVACAGAGMANHADIVCVPENLVVKIRHEEFLRAASITTIGAIALQGIRRAQPQLGETVCVLGLGLLGQITVQLAVLSGCKVIGIDIMPERLELAKKLGAHHVFNATTDSVVSDISFLTNHHGVDTTIITAASASDALLQQAMEITRRKGKVVIVGDVGLGLKRDPFYKKEIDVLISCSYGPGRYDAAYEQQGKDYPYAYVRWTENRNMAAFIELLETKRVSIDTLIAHTVSIDDAPQAYELLKNKQVLGVVLSYIPKQEAPKVEIIPAQKLQAPAFAAAIKETVRVGVIGAGGFAKIKLMPMLARMRSVSINAIVDADAANATNVARQYNAHKTFSDNAELLAQDLVDAVVIASPHKYHCDQALAALQHGKAVFLEKPMVTNFEQLATMKNFLQTYPNVRFCVDYNRSFAPFVQKIKEAISVRSTPLMVHYRMNAGYIPKDHWVQTEVGAGRMIGEGCHIIDLFCYLTEARPVAVSVESINTSRSDLGLNDNFSAQIRFNDGSLCTLMYTALGHSTAGKERMELFFDGKSIIMDDYLTLRGFGLPTAFNEQVRTADKGHEAMMKQFFAAIKEDNFVPPIDFDRLNRVAELSLVIDQLASSGGGEKSV